MILVVGATGMVGRRPAACSQPRKRSRAMVRATADLARWTSSAPRCSVVQGDLRDRIRSGACQGERRYATASSMPAYRPGNTPQTTDEEGYLV
jgi:hypothetical protein